MMMKLIGPFKQIITLNNLPLKGALKDEQLEIIENGGILVNNGFIQKVGNYKELKATCDALNTVFEIVKEDCVALPGFVDAHTHICFAGSRAKDYAARNNGKTYLEIAANGGGIWDTVQQTRLASEEELAELMHKRIAKMLANGITTAEVKSGYGLSTDQELKILRVIKKVSQSTTIDLIATCLAAHIIPKEHDSEEIYLNEVLEQLVPSIKKENLCHRFDIFIEKGAFSTENASKYLRELKTQNFDLVIHGDQFTVGGSEVAINCEAISVDHLEASTVKEITALSKSEVIPVVLPGASIGLGCGFAPARALLDAGCSLVIASDWNPGSAPQGDLLFQAAVLGTFEKLSAAEIFAGITFRAAKALNLNDRGKIQTGQKADFIVFPTNDFREILYHQGQLKPKAVWKDGQNLFIQNN